MENSKESSCIRNMVWSKQSLLPPKCPFPSISPSFSDYIPYSAIGSRPIQKPREGNSHHQRTFSESVIIEEQPSWLDDLLNEPETPVRKVGHRRSSSDSFAYIDATNAAYRDHAPLNEYKFKNQASGPLWIPHKMGCFKDTRHASFTVESNSGGKPMKTWDLSSNSVNCSSGLPSVVDDTVPQTSGSSCALLDADGAASTATEKKESIDCSPNNTKGSSEKKDCSSAKPSTSETDTKRAKQQYAQRSRVRKLQYIAELERNVQALQAEGSEVSAELEFMNQQNLILSMENKALKQRLESLAQEHLIKHLEQDVLEREIVRLRAMFQQHHHPQQQKPSAHRRNSSRDVDSQFANLSLKHREAGSAGWDPVSGHLNIRQST